LIPWIPYVLDVCQKACQQKQLGSHHTQSDVFDRLDEELKRLKQSRSTNGRRLSAAEGITKEAQAAYQVHSEIALACTLLCVPA